MIVVLIVADSVRADAPGFGGGPARTPRLDRLAREGTVFQDTFSSAAWTVPSLVALTTGTYPHRVGVSRWRHPFPSHRPTLMSAFAAAGFEVQTLVHNPRFCLANTGARGTVGDSEQPDAVVEALRAPRGTDRFVLVHHWWTHLPYRNVFIPKKPWKKLCDEAINELGHEPEEAVPRLRDEYHDALSWFDSELLGRYLDAASSGGNDVLFAFTADHGENWGESIPDDHAIEHIYDMHGRWMTDETTRVPWVLWSTGPTVPAGAKLGGFARGVDLAPTLAGLAGVPWPGPLPTERCATWIDRGISPSGEGLVLDGHSLAEEVLAGRPAPFRQALTVTSHNAIVPARYPRSGRRMWSRFGLRTEGRRYLWDGLFGLREVADLGADPQIESRMARLRDRLVETPRVWSRLAEHRRRALGPGERLDKELYPPLAAQAAEEDSAEADTDLEGQMRMLGYAED